MSTRARFSTTRRSTQGAHGEPHRNIDYRYGGRSRQKWDEDTRTLRDEDGNEYDENGGPVEDDENGEPDMEALTDAINAGAEFVDNIAEEDNRLDETVTYPEFLQIIVNANSPAWPTFATKLEDEAATNAAWERWQEIVEGQREERRQEAIHEEAKRLDHEEFLRLCEEAKKGRNA